MRVYVGYDFLYLSNAVRPGDQIDRELNPTQIPVNGSTGGLVGAPRPTFNFHETDFWAQGIRFGVALRF
jgi:Putative beta barrel porin-7 (BBP7)